MSIRKIAIAGANGTIGKHIFDHLYKQKKYDITILTRPDSNKTFKDGVHVIKVDYNDVPSLVKALHGIDALVTAIKMNVVETQKNLAKTVKKRRIIRTIH